MKRVTGLGGVFLKCKNPEAMYQWYEKHLGIQRDQSTTIPFTWRDHDRPEQTGQTIWALFPEDTKYFAPSSSPFMMNFRVENLEAVLEALRAEGVEVDPKVETYDFGKFGWIMDPEGNRIELWEPTPEPQGSES
jgi:catechol 2,3-dioxygenase-like lactoylglutathione lyase family enzyme